MRAVNVIEKDGKYILVDEYLQHREFKTVRELVNELMHYTGSTYTKDRAWQLLRYYSNQIGR